MKNENNNKKKKKNNISNENNNNMKEIIKSNQGSSETLRKVTLKMDANLEVNKIESKKEEKSTEKFNLDAYYEVEGNKAEREF